MWVDMFVPTVDMAVYYGPRPSPLAVLTVKPPLVADRPSSSILGAIPPALIPWIGGTDIQGITHGILQEGRRRVPYMGAQGARWGIHRVTYVVTVPAEEAAGGAFRPPVTKPEQFLYSRSLRNTWSLDSPVANRVLSTPTKSRPPLAAATGMKSSTTAQSNSI
nr:protein MOTHER of FT and TFL1 [Ipomoea batatas]